MDSLGHTDCIIKEMLWVEVNAFLEWMHFVYCNRLNAVKSEDVYLRSAIG